MVGDDGAELHIPQPMQRGLLTVLLLHSNQVMTADRLTESVWDADGSTTSPGALRTQIWALRKRLAPASWLHTGEYRSYQLEVRPGELDVTQFRPLTGQGRAALRSGDLPGAVSYLTGALAVRGDPPLADVPATLAMGPVARRLLDERSEVRELLHEARPSLGQYVSLIPELRESTAADPANGRLWEQLMLALRHTGHFVSYLHVISLRVRAAVAARRGSAL